MDGLLVECGQVYQRLCLNWSSTGRATECSDKDCVSDKLVVVLPKCSVKVPKCSAIFELSRSSTGGVVECSNKDCVLDKITVVLVKCSIEAP